MNEEQLILSVLEQINEKMDALESLPVTIVEGFYLITFSVIISVGLLIFWNNTTKW